MDRFFDEAARILATEIPRRQALLRIGALIGGGVLAALGVQVVEAQLVCPKGKPPCPGKPGPGGYPPFCVSGNKTCCGKTSCPQNQTCCRGPTKDFCISGNKTCCGDNSCNQNEKCCNVNKVCCKVCTKTGPCASSPS